MDVADGIMQYDLGVELNKECLESFLGHMAMLGSHLCYQFLVSTQAADGYLIVFREVDAAVLPCPLGVWGCRSFFASPRVS